MEEIFITAIDPLKVEVCDINPAMEGNMEPSSVEEKVDLGNLLLFSPQSYVNKETEEVNFMIKEETSENNMSDRADIKKESRINIFIHLIHIS